ncbi:MAG: diguanylate cyclase [Proteobacteria bacterium]|nr:diguanylate cyclase [Pseudomonadota bacterium]MBU1452891.1 diguanylate cyclase [Pseudomonadota bacterium]MBU2469302.1 diguanylate cyclase [Pseudomonadota bacterium]MBU2517588.1 diguanylate cyclase [Pseudomonadota bacterium]
MDRNPEDPSPQGSISSHCWLEVPDLTAVDHQSPAHILLLASTPQEGARLAQILSGQGHRVTLAAHWGEAMERLEGAQDLELIITELDSQDPRGLGLTHYLGEPHMLSSLPVIVICRENDLEPLVNQWSNGAADFLSQPYGDTELLVRVKRALIQQRTMRLYLRAAHRDPLTGLYNKRVFAEMLPREMSRSQRNNVPLGLIFADLDHFKQVNDAHGHLTGDQVLQAFARRLCLWVREGDLVARYGGEEFVVLAPGAGIKGISVLAERVRQAMERPISTRLGPLTVTVSQGAVVFNGEEGLSPSAFLDQADQAQYQAKAQGRNRVVLAKG